MCPCAPGEHPSSLKDYDKSMWNLSTEYDTKARAAIDDEKRSEVSASLLTFSLLLPLAAFLPLSHQIERSQILAAFLSPCCFSC